jgi:WD40 repeat protein
MPSTLSPEISIKKAHEFAFSPDSKCVAYIGGRYVTMLDIGTREPLFAVHPIANPSSVDFSPDGHRLVVQGTSGRTIILDSKTGELLCDFRNRKDGEGDAAFFTACSRFVASVSWSGLFSVRDIKTSDVVFSQTYNDCQLRRLSTTADRSLFVYSVGGRPHSPDGLTPCTVALHRWPTRSVKAQVLPREWAAIGGLQISPSGRLLAVVHGTPPSTLEIYNISTLRTVARRDWSGPHGCSIAWTFDERAVVVTEWDGFRVYELPKLTVSRELPIEYPCFVQFSPTEKFVAFGSWKKSFIIATDYLAEFAKRRRDA